MRQRVPVVLVAAHARASGPRPEGPGLRANWANSVLPHSLLAVCDTAAWAALAGAVAEWASSAPKQVFPV